MAPTLATLNEHLSPQAHEELAAAMKWLERFADF